MPIPEVNNYISAGTSTCQDTDANGDRQWSSCNYMCMLSTTTRYWTLFFPEYLPVNH